MALLHALRVPLDRQNAPVLAFDSLDDAVPCPGANGKAGGDILHRLVVVGIGPQLLLPQHRRQAAARGKAHRVVGFGAAFGLLAVPVGLGALGGDILPKGSAKGHVYQLKPPADSQHRLLLGSSLAEQLQLELVLLPVDAGYLLHRLLPKKLGGDVYAAGDKQPVKHRSQAGAVLQAGGDGQQHRDAPGPDNHFYIGIVGFIDAALPPAGGHSNDGLHGVLSFSFSTDFPSIIAFGGQGVNTPFPNPFAAPG